MVSTGYGTEATWEGIFNVPASDVDATRFAFLNQYIAQQFNFYITGDANTDITDTKITPILASITHSLIYEIYLLSKANFTVQPWDGAMAYMNQVDISVRYRNFIKQAQNNLYGGLELVTCDLPDKTDRSY